MHSGNKINYEQLEIEPMHQPTKANTLVHVGFLRGLQSLELLRPKGFIKISLVFSFFGFNR